MTLYDQDFHAWAEEQAGLARSRSANALDWDNVAEELESLGKQQRGELRSRYEVLILHLLQWMHQPERRGRSWTNSIAVQRDRIDEHLAENPSLKASDLEMFVSAYRRARREASTETDLDLEVFPIDPPFTAEQARSDDYWPGVEQRDPEGC